MARGNAALNYNRRKADAYAPQGLRSAARPAFQPYTPPLREERQAQKKRDRNDYHPAVPLMTVTPAEVRAICLVIFVVAAVALAIVMLSAEATAAQKEINDLKRGIAQVDDDIANLKIEIEQARNMQIIKNRAHRELGLKEPAFDQYVYISDLEAPKSDFGRYIKERAYGGARSQAAEPDKEQ